MADARLIMERPGTSRKTNISGSSELRATVCVMRPLLHQFSAPGEGARRYRMQPAFGVAGNPERLEQRARLANDLLRHEFADADHLVAVIGVRDDIAIVAEDIENREGIRREAADAAGLFLVIQPMLALEALVTEG